MKTHDSSTGRKEPLLVQLLSMDILENIMRYSDNPGKLGVYLTSQMRGLIGARLVVMLQYKDDVDGSGHRVVSVFPPRYKELAGSPELERLASFSRDIDKAVLWSQEKSPPEVREIMSSMGHQMSIAVPLNVGATRVGALLVLDLLDKHRVQDVLRLLDMLSSIVALVLRKSSLYENQEAVIEERTLELAQSERLFRSLAEVSPVGIFRADARGRFTYVNERFCQIAGVPQKDIEARGWESSVHPEDYSYVQKEWRRAIKGKKFFHSEFRFLQLDGIATWVKGQAIAESDESGKVIGYIGTITDITDHKRAEEALEKYKDLLEDLVEERTRELEESHRKLLTAERLAVLGQFSGSIAHEIRNPLGVIDSSAYFLKAKLAGSDDKIKTHLDRIKSEVQKCTGIIESMHNLTRMREPRKEPLDLVLTVKESIAATKIPEAVSVECVAPEGEIPVAADAEQLGMVFRNILVNAVQATEGRGTISANLRTRGDGWAEVSIRDTGMGIPPEQLEKVFEPLFSTKAKGIGFGMAIAKMIAEKHGGIIEVESEPAKGATFTVRLPLFSQEQSGVASHV